MAIFINGNQIAPLQFQYFVQEEMIIKHRLSIFVRYAGQVDKLNVVSFRHLGLDTHQIISI